MFFGFEAVGVLFYDYEKEYFYTDSDFSKDEVLKANPDESSSAEEDTNSEGSDALSIGSGRVNAPVNLRQTATFGQE